MEYIDPQMTWVDQIARCTAWLCIILAKLAQGSCGSLLPSGLTRISNLLHITSPRQMLKSKVQTMVSIECQMLFYTIMTS